MVVEQETTLTLGERLVQVLDGLGLPQAHFGVRGSQQLTDLASKAPSRIASLVVQGDFGSPSALAPFLTPVLDRSPVPSWPF